jgi:heme-degrading monooxygenase HmoA
MISRQWRGMATPGRAADYLHHLESQTFPGLAKLPGFVRASILKREIGESTEFQVVTEWESLDAIHAFAGADISLAVVPEAARALLSSYDDYVVHYDIERSFEPPKR